jgi:peptidoglycan hydrolase CwlO-like protein
MLEWHEELKKLRRDQKQLEEQSAREKEHLETQETRQENLRAEVQRLEERNAIQKKVATLKQSIPFVEYKSARLLYRDCKKKKQDAQSRLADLKAEVNPTLESVNRKRDYRDKISTVVSDRKKNVKTAERAADSVLREIEKLDASIVDIEGKADAERGSGEGRKREILQIQRKIKDVESRMTEEPIEFNSVEWNEKIVSRSWLVIVHANECPECQAA